MICFSPTSPPKIRNGRSAVTPRPLLNPTTSKGSGESMGKANSVKLSLEERKAKAAEYQRQYRAANKARIAETDRKWREANKEKLAIRHHDWHKTNKEKVNARKKEWRKKNKGKIKKKNDKYRQDNKEEIAIYAKDYCKKNAKKIADCKRKWRQSHKDEIAESNRIYRIKNKVAIANSNRLYVKNRRMEDDSFRLTSSIRSRLYSAIRNDHKVGSAVGDLGCSIDDLKAHLESLFDENMTWENWGTYWHVDHIFPLAAANKEDRAEFLAVNNWRNLQPLEAKANIAKGDKVTPAARKLFNKLVKEFS